MPHGVAEQNKNKAKRIHFSGREVKRESGQGSFLYAGRSHRNGEGVPFMSPHIVCLFLFCFDSLEYCPPCPPASLAPILQDSGQIWSSETRCEFPVRDSLLGSHLSEHSPWCQKRLFFFFFFGVIIFVSIWVTYFSCQILGTFGDKWLSFASCFVFGTSVFSL